jgi:hypothetical protein
MSTSGLGISLFTPSALALQLTTKARMATARGEIFMSIRNPPAGRAISQPCDDLTLVTSS